MKSTIISITIFTFLVNFSSCRVLTKNEVVNNKIQTNSHNSSEVSETREDVLSKKQGNQTLDNSSNVSEISEHSTTRKITNVNETQIKDKEHVSVHSEVSQHQTVRNSEVASNVSESRKSPPKNSQNASHQSGNNSDVIEEITIHKGSQVLEEVSQEKSREGIKMISAFISIVTVMALM